MSQINTQNTGPAYWRSLEEYADTAAFHQLVAQEFPGYDPDQIKALSRRRFMKLMGASMALAGVTATGCRRWPQQQVVPFANRPGGRVPGAPQQYATITERAGVACGLLVESLDGRPMKVEGNPQHPFSRGATDTFAQAAILQVYDPDRSRTVAHSNGSRSTWQAFETFARQHFEPRRSDGSSVAVLAEASNSPSMANHKKRLLEAYPGARWYEWEPINRDHEIAGSRLAFGRAIRPHYLLDKATIVACFDSDLLGSHPAWVRHARDWSIGRKSADQEKKMNRLYAVESSFSITGSVADERVTLKPSQIPALLDILYRVLTRATVQAPVPAHLDALVSKLYTDLANHRGRSIVVAGPDQPAEVHALVWAINDALGNLGQTITLAKEPGSHDTSNLQDITELTGRLQEGQIDTLLILGGNPVYNAPADLHFADALDQVETSIHLSLYFNETSTRCHWHLPKAHWLESWGDGRAWDGTVSVQQPLIMPLFAGRSAIEVLALVLDQKPDKGYDMVRRTFADWLPDGGFESAWRKVLHEGLLAGSKYEAFKGRPASAKQTMAPVPAGDGFELVFRPGSSTHDGSYANNGWLQELPDPLTKLTWDNAALVNIADAKRLKLSNGDIVKIGVSGRELEIAAYLMPGQPQGVITLPLGYGRTAAGHVGNGVGFDTYRVRTVAGIGTVPVATVAKTPKRYQLALTQNHHLIDWAGRKATEKRIGQQGHSGYIVKEATVNQYRRDPHFVQRDVHGNYRLQLYDGPVESEAKRPGGPTAFNHPHAWGMAVDMNSCIGCNACVVACQAENNVPVVGKDQVLVSREMQWIRIDRYFKNDPKADPNAEHPDVIYMPMMCQQCENAPCEQVCPVAATTHDSEGLNVMVYNRCIGTRYCSNNCPYKVRRFNFFDYHSKDPRGNAMPWLGWPDAQQRETISQLKQMAFNPEVTVRMRGVMEKCTYCIQRIARAKSTARAEFSGGLRATELIQDGEILTACQQACPTQVIFFGDLNDPNSKVSQLQQNNRAYGVLEDLNTRPRTKYLAKLRNPATV